MHYSLTDRRAVFYRDGRSRSVRELPLRPSIPFEISVGRDGRGSVVFGASTAGSSFWSMTSNPMTLWAGPGVDGFEFYRIEDIEIVSDLVRSIVHRPQD